MSFQSLLLVVKEVVSQVIAYVSKDPATKHGYCGIPIIEEYRVRELVEG